MLTIVLLLCLQATPAETQEFVVTNINNGTMYTVEHRRYYSNISYLQLVGTFSITNKYYDNGQGYEEEYSCPEECRTAKPIIEWNIQYRMMYGDKKGRADTPTQAADIIAENRLDKLKQSKKQVITLEWSKPGE